MPFVPQTAVDNLKEALLGPQGDRRLYIPYQHIWMLPAASYQGHAVAYEVKFMEADGELSSRCWALTCRVRANEVTHDC